MEVCLEKDFIFNKMLASTFQLLRHLGFQEHILRNRLQSNMYSFRGFTCYVQQLMRVCPNKLFLGKVAGIAIYRVLTKS